MDVQGLGAQLRPIRASDDRDHDFLRAAQKGLSEFEGWIKQRVTRSSPGIGEWSLGIIDSKALSATRNAMELKDNLMA